VREQLESRLKTLRYEFETGQDRLRELESQQAHLRETLLRISGAVQILEEMLAVVPANGPAAERRAAAAE
jgi:predicted nuclease with TOPRIM domain